MRTWYRSGVPWWRDEPLAAADRATFHGGDGADCTDHASLDWPCA